MWLTQKIKNRQKKKAKEEKEKKHIILLIENKFKWKCYNLID